MQTLFRVFRIISSFVMRPSWPHFFARRFSFIHARENLYLVYHTAPGKTNPFCSILTRLWACERYQGMVKHFMIEGRFLNVL